MAGLRNYFTIEMAIVVLLVLAVIDFTVAQTGVCYGRIGGNLPPPPEVVQLYNQNGIRRMRIYDPHQPTLEALKGSNIELIIGVPNDKLGDIAGSQDNANSWVQNNVRNYPDVRFKYIAVGNEVSPLKGDTSQYVSSVVPAMRNIQNAISAAGLADRIKVSTAVETGLIDNTSPPENGIFRPQVRTYVEQIIQFLNANRAPLLVNIYPYFARIGDPQNVPLDFALFRSPGSNGYPNLFHAILDATYAALEKTGGSSLEIVVSESGWPSAGERDASVANARTYNTNLVQQVKNGSPKRPGRAIETYIFAMFDEDQKQGPDYERNFGLFRPNKEAKYQISFN